MTFDFGAWKAEARQVVHDNLAVSASYLDSTLDEPVELGVRFHSKINRFGDMLEQGWAEVLEGVNRLLFNIPELTEKDVTLRRGGKVTFTAPGFENIVLVLHAQEPSTGPITLVYQVSQE